MFGYASTLITIIGNINGVLVMGHLLIVVKQSWLSQECRTTFWFGGNDAVMANAQDLCDALYDAYDTNLVGKMVPEWSLYEFDVYDKTVPGVPGIQLQPTGGVLVGTSGGDSLPTQIAGLVTFKAQVAPPNTNRKYLPGLNDGIVVDSLFTQAAIDSMQDWADEILDIATTTALAVTMEVVSLNLDGTVNGGNPLTYAIAKQVPATQRRRRIGSGI